MNTPTLIFLNGTSSAGKTSIAEALQKALNDPYLYFSADVLKPMLPPYKEGLDWVVKDILERKNQGYYRCLAAMLETGNFIIADQAIDAPDRLRNCANVLKAYRAFLVGVKCPFEVAEQRERERGDRMLGLVQDQFEKVHQHGIYDFEVDSSLLSPDESAAQIARFIERNEPKAFRLLTS